METKQNTNIVVILAVLLVGGIAGYLIAGQGKAGYHMGDSNGVMQRESMQGEDVGNGNMGQGMHMMVSSEREFIEEMIPHHQEAVDTAKEVIERGGTTEEIMDLVEGIVVAQEAEIADMKAWYENWYGEAYVDSGEYQPMMRDLSSLSGEELDRVFLEDMIMHHMGAIMMARSVQRYIEHDEIADLTEAIILTQTEEIVDMRGMLSGL